MSADEGPAPLAVFAELAAAGDRRERLSYTCLAGEPSSVALDAHSAISGQGGLRQMLTSHKVPVG